MPFPSPEELYAMNKDVFEDSSVQSIAYWKCGNHDEPTNEEEYLAKAEDDLDAFSDCVDEILDTIE